ncbi:MAG: ROK family protein [Candidatus Omnitrophica bacterium]|nr:ROK family protein [Candidatus Omnitrophota bacterium]
MKKYFIGIDLGGTNTRVALINKRFAILDRASFPTRTSKTPQRFVSAVCNSVNNLLKKRGLTRRDVIGIGMGIPGQMDIKKGIIYSLTNIKGFNGVNIKRLFAKRIKIPLYIDNDVNVMTLAELHKGAGKGKKNLVCITLGTGVGGGIIINGRLHRGHLSSAGEIGHIPINVDGPRCNCGGIACIESYVGNSYIIKEVKRRIGRGEKTIIKRLAGGNVSRITPELLYKAAKRRDKFAVVFWKEIGFRIGVMLSGVINLLSPDKVIIGGGVAQAGRFILNPIKETVKKRAMNIQRRHVKIVRASLGRDAGLVGAAVLVSLERDGNI